MSTARAAEPARRLDLRTDDGVRLAVHRLGTPGATPVVLVPGTFSNHTFWLGTRGTGFARALAARGFEAWVLDPRGHGLSQRPRRHDRWHFDHWVRHDVPAALRAAARDGRRPLLVGHSAGGSAALAALAADPELRTLAAGVAVAGTPAPWLQFATRRIAARVIGRSARLLGRFPARLLRLGPEDELPGVIAQWMEWNLQGRWTGDDGTDYRARLADLRLPVLALAGAGDRAWAPPSACRALVDSIGSSRKEFLLCGREAGFRHDYGHADLLVSRAARTEVWPRLLDWIARHAAPPGPAEPAPDPSA